MQRSATQNILLCLLIGLGLNSCGAERLPILGLGGIDGGGNKDEGMDSTSGGGNRKSEEQPTADSAPPPAPGDTTGLCQGSDPVGREFIADTAATCGYGGVKASCLTSLRFLNPEKVELSFKEGAITQIRRGSYSLSCGWVSVEVTDGPYTMVMQFQWLSADTMKLAGTGAEFRDQDPLP